MWIFSNIQMHYHFHCLGTSRIAEELFSINTSWGTVPKRNANLGQLLIMNNIVKCLLSLPATPPSSAPVKELWKDEELGYSQQELEILQLVVPPGPCGILAKRTSSLAFGNATLSQHTCKEKSEKMDNFIGRGTKWVWWIWIKHFMITGGFVWTMPLDATHVVEWIWSWMVSPLLLLN